MHHPFPLAPLRTRLRSCEFSLCPRLRPDHAHGVSASTTTSPRDLLARLAEGFALLDAAWVADHLTFELTSHAGLIHTPLPAQLAPRDCELAATPPHRRSALLCHP